MFNKCEFHTELKETAMDQKKTQKKKTMGFEGHQLHRAAWYSPWWAKADRPLKMSPPEHAVSTLSGNPVSSFKVLPCRSNCLRRKHLVFLQLSPEYNWRSMEKYFLHSSASWDSLRNHFIFYLLKTVGFYFI